MSIYKRLYSYGDNSSLTEALGIPANAVMNRAAMFQNNGTNKIPRGKVAKLATDENAPLNRVFQKRAAKGTVKAKAVVVQEQAPVPVQQEMVEEQVEQSLEVSILDALVIESETRELEMKQGYESKLKEMARQIAALQVQQQEQVQSLQSELVKAKEEQAKVVLGLETKLQTEVECVQGLEVSLRQLRASNVQLQATLQEERDSFEKSVSALKEETQGLEQQLARAQQIKLDSEVHHLKKHPLMQMDRFKVLPLTKKLAVKLLDAETGFKDATAQLKAHSDKVFQELLLRQGELESTRRSLESVPLVGFSLFERNVEAPEEMMEEEIMTVDELHEFSQEEEDVEDLEEEEDSDVSSIEGFSSDEEEDELDMDGFEAGEVCVAPPPLP